MKTNRVFIAVLCTMKNQTNLETNDYLTAKRQKNERKTLT